MSLGRLGQDLAFKSEAVLSVGIEADGAAFQIVIDILIGDGYRRVNAKGYDTLSATREALREFVESCNGTCD